VTGPDLAPGALGVEWTVLERLAGGLAGAADEERWRTLLGSPELRWGELLEQAVRHKMIASLAFHAERLGADLPAKIAEHLGLVLRANRHRVRVLQSEACQLARRLEAEGVPFAATKGVVLASAIYGDTGERMMADVDFLIPPAAGPQVERVLEEAGFVEGRWDARERRAVPFTRRERIEFRLNPHHLPHRLKVLEDPLVGFVDVGFATSLSWTSSGFDVPLEPLLAQARQVPVPGGWLPALAPGSELLHLALVLYKYASFSVYLEAGADVHLAAFADLVRLWRRHGREIRAGGLPGDPELRRIFTWSLEHADRLFGTGMLAALGLRYAGSDDELRRVFFSGRRAVVPAVDFRCRLQSKDRRRLFLEEAAS